MSRQRKGPRLWLRPARRRNGRTIASPVWIIKDGSEHIATGCIAGPTKTRPPVEAEKALAAYIASKYEPARSKRTADEIDIADVLSIYYSDTVDRQGSPKRFGGRVSRLNEFFGGRKLAEINPQLCKQYWQLRGGLGGARRDLEDLRAAIGHHAKQNLHDENIHVTLPPRGLPRERFLTRSEAAILLWTCWRYRETQTIHRGPKKNQKVETSKRPLAHIARFILIALYTGTRAGAVAAASPYAAEGRSFVDLDQAIFYRLSQGKRQTNKRQTPVPLPKRLVAHLRRWRDRGIIKSHFVEWNGKQVRSVKTGFGRAVRLANLSADKGKVSPHTLRHTAATWLMQAGVPIWEAAGFLGMSPQTLVSTYGHHQPEFMRTAAKAITDHDRRTNKPVVKSVVALSGRRS